MKYLIKGGRVSSFKGFIAGLLKFKLVLALKKDGLKLVGKTTKVENVPELVEEAFKEETGYNGKDIEKLVIFTSNVVDNKFDASSTIDVLKNKFKGVNIEYSELPSVIAAHVGPSYVAIAIKVK
jgi:fatty acid-binding protein DegV